MPTSRREKFFGALALVVFLASCLLAAGQTTQASSSYIDDVILPTAKMTLSKLQQSIGTITAGVSGVGQAALNNREIASENETSALGTPSSSEPSKGDFVSLNLTSWPSKESSKETTDQLIQVSSTESTREDPTSTSATTTQETVTKETTSSSMKENNTNEQQVSSSENNINVSPTTTTTTTSESPNLIDGGSILDLASIKETESEAIAAVDASMNFGDLLGLGADTCYDEYGNARFCEPEFENVAAERQVEVSSECGRPPSRFCTTYAYEHNDQIRNCHICDSQHPRKRHPASYLTDMNSASAAPTCWVSAPIGDGVANKSSTIVQRDNVTLQLNFEKKYEITYISLQFCSLRPDSLALYKSQDFGRTWTPYQFYSSQCAQVYPQQQQVTASCINSSALVGQAASRLAFSTLDSSREKSTPILETELKDWQTATNVRVVLDRHQASWIQANNLHQQAQNNQSEQVAENSLMKPSDTYNYAVADLTVAGRCRCNGHASKCVHGEDGRLQCDCRHNTAGRDCERCAPFHFDRPWQRATQMDASPCQPCQCNGHSRKCRFDAELYQLSGKRSGGVCINCRDNTAGRHCHYCKEGYTRDHSKPMSDKEACKPCDCHPVGSLGRVCNQTSGQCPCKEGVTGLECNRCAPGYQQSSSPTEPCIRLPENDINYEPTIEAAAEETPSVGESNLDSGPNSWPRGETPQQVVEQAQQSKQRQGSTGLRRPEMPGGADLADSGQFYNGQDLGDTLTGGHFGTRQRQGAQARPSWQQNRARQQYYAQKRHRQPQYELGGDEFGPSNDEDDNDGQPQEFAARHHQLYGQHIYYQNKRFGGRHHQVASGADSASGLNVASDEEFGSMVPSVSYAAPPTSIDGPANDENNNIQAGARNTWQPSGLTYQRPRLHQGVNQQQQVAQRRRVEQQQQQLTTNSLACADCQSGTKRLSFRQFCQLEYAIRAQVLNKLMADDWTRYDVEIHDIFKSPPTGMGPGLIAAQHLDQTAHHLGQQNKVLSANNYVDQSFFMQSDDPNVNNNQTASKQQQQQQQPAASLEQLSLMHRLKIGSIQSIWVPTEDVACRCPRLKLRATYLLMGLVDAKENSATSIQLDRHGLALEWKPSLQERLIKYQRRHSRNKC